jgi:tetratricopeptide (TPR) repeat protein
MREEFTRPLSPTDLAEWDWKDFERFALGVLRDYYRQSGLELEPTPYVHERDKDGEAIYVFGHPVQGGSAPDLASVTRMWVEVKQIQKGIDLDRVSGHVMLATNQRVTKLILVTNGVFADRVKRDLRAYSTFARLSLAFVEGAALLDLYSSLSGYRPNVDRGRPHNWGHATKPASPPFACSVYFAASPHEEQTLSAASLGLEPGDPLFVIIDVEAGESLVWGDIQLEVDTEPEVGDALPLWSSLCAPLVPGEQFREVYVCYPPAGAVIGPNAIRVSIASALDPLVTTHATGSAQVKTMNLAPVELASHRPGVKELHRILDTWLNEGGVTLLGLRAPGGVGKSHQMRALRARWLTTPATAPHEIFLDGGVHTQVEDFTDQVLRAVLQIPRSAPDPEVDRALEALCERCELHPRAAASLRSGWRRFQQGDTGPTLKEPGEMLFALLTLASAERPVVIAVEDAHKLGPSTLQLLLEVLRLLRHGCRGKVLFVATSRPVAPHGTTLLVEGEADPLAALFDLLGAGLVELPSPSHGDAIALLTASVAGLRAELADLIVEQVGTTPFALKEVLLLLETERAIRRTGGGNEIFEIQDLAAFELKLRPGKLVNATRDRLMELRMSMGAAAGVLDDFLACGAVIGRTFPTSLALAGAGADALPSGSESLLFRWDVMRTWRREGRLVSEFAHDLIRAAVLDSLEHDRLQRLASCLDETGLPTLSPLTRARVAAHAGNHERCKLIAQESEQNAESGYRFWDAFQSVLLQLCVVDPDRFTRVLLQGELLNLVALDDGLRLIALQADGIHRSAQVRAVYDLLFRCISLLSRIGVNQARGAAPLLTEVAMLAEELDDDLGRARIEYFRGRAEFDSDNFFASAQHHHAAEVRLSETDPNGADRLVNLHRLFLCERQMGRLERANACLRHIEAVSGDRADAGVRARMITYRGYADLYHDLRQTQVLWKEALAVSSAAGLEDRIIDHRLGCAYVATLLDEASGALEHFADAEARLQTRDLESFRLRLFLNRGALHLASGHLAEARVDLEEAQRIAVKYGNFRRLWRVDANLATVFEASGDSERSLSYERRSMAGWKVRAAHEERFGERAPWLGQRHVLAPLNIALRARAGSEAHSALLEQLSNSARAEIHRLASLIENNTPDLLPGCLEHHFKVVRGRVRAVLTE